MTSLPAACQRGLVRLVFLLAVAGTVALPQRAAAQTPAVPVLPAASMPVEEAAAIAQYWALVAERRFDEAASTIGRFLSRYPTNISAFALLIEVDIARGGSATALASYETWLGPRTLEEPGVLRRVARATLYEWARQATNGPARSEALEALAQDGDAAALGVVSALIQEGQEAGLRMGVRLKDERSVGVLVERVRTMRGLKLREIQLLAQSGSQAAVPGLIEVLADPQAENRAAAADALGKIGGPGAENALRPMLSDPHGGVRTAVAGALFRLGNFSGASILNELEASGSTSVSRSAALLMASQPDEAWKSLVRSLLSDPEPVIRLDAARMLAPHEPDTVRPVLEQLSFDANLAIREETELVIAELPITNLAQLRAILRSGTPLGRVRAARRLLVMTR